MHRSVLPSRSTTFNFQLFRSKPLPQEVQLRVAQEAAALWPSCCERLLHPPCCLVPVPCSMFHPPRTLFHASCSILPAPSSTFHRCVLPAPPLAAGLVQPVCLGSPGCHSWCWRCSSTWQQPWLRAVRTGRWGGAQKPQPQGFGCWWRVLAGRWLARSSPSRVLC